MISLLFHEDGTMDNKDAPVLINNWYVSAIAACLITGLILFPWPSGNKKADSVAQEATKNTFSEFEAEWFNRDDSFFKKDRFRIRNNTNQNLNDVSVEATFYRDDGAKVTEKIYQGKWKNNDKIQFTVGAHEYQKETIKGTAMREDGSPVILTGQWFLVPN
jgi:lipopolysaccharide export LptBFGC system permease protein LptF